MIGPITFLLLSKFDDGSALERLDEIVPLYADLLHRLADAGVEWVQIDEPALVADRTDAELAATRSVYDRLAALDHRPAILVASYFGDLGAALPVLTSTGIEGSPSTSSPDPSTR